MKKSNNKKSILKSIVAIVSMSLMIAGCGTNAEDILKMYDTYNEAGTDANKAGISIQMQPTGDILIHYSNPLLNTSEENIQKLSERWFVTDAENPDVRLSAEMKTTTAGTNVNDSTQVATYEHHLILKTEQMKERFLLIGFEGIALVESKEAETLPLFFLVEIKGAESKMLTPLPRLAGELFPVNYNPVFFTEQEYSGEIAFAKSKNIVLYLTLSADLKKVIQLKLSVEKLHLTPANFDKQRKKSQQASIFKYLKNTMIREIYAIKTINGINVIARDASGYPIISDVQLDGGGLETTSPIGIIDGKITLHERPLICDLTVTNSCVYGTIKVELEGCGTQSTYAVFKNTTTPQDIPENIIK